jgi:plastocyanin
MRLAVFLVAVGVIAAALIASGPREAPAAARAGVITMGHEEFGRSAVTIRAGQRLTFSNPSHWLHVLVPGKGARQESQKGLPRLGSRNAHLSERGDHWTTGAWTTPGTYFLTCQLHPEMTLEVKVLSAKSTPSLRRAGDRPS